MTHRQTATNLAKTSQKYYNKISVVKLIQFIGYYILIENEYSQMNRDMKENFATVKATIDENFTSKEMPGLKRYSAIKSCVVPQNGDFDSMVETWVQFSKEHWTPGSEKIS
jgi:hypothetical protein